MIIEITQEEYKELHPDLNANSGSWNGLVFTKTVENDKVLAVRRWFVKDNVARSVQAYVMEDSRGKAKRLMEEGVQYWLDKGLDVILTTPIEQVQKILSLKPKYDYIVKDNGDWFIQA